MKFMKHIIYMRVVYRFTVLQLLTRPLYPFNSLRLPFFLFIFSGLFLAFFFFSGGRKGDMNLHQPSHGTPGPLRSPLVAHGASPSPVREDEATCPTAGSRQRAAADVPLWDGRTHVPTPGPGPAPRRQTRLGHGLPAAATVHRDGL